MERMSTNTNPRPLLTVFEVAERLHVSPSTVRRRIVDGSIPAVRIGRGAQPLVRVNPDELDAWLYVHLRR
jgi:excisionase family DNA binding protein